MTATCAACLTPTSSPVDARGRCTYCATFDLTPLLLPEPPPVEPMVAVHVVEAPVRPPDDTLLAIGAVMALASVGGLVLLGASVCGAVLGGG